jgi:hypothetical protein
MNEEVRPKNGTKHSPSRHNKIQHITTVMVRKSLLVFRWDLRFVHQRGIHSNNFFQKQ